MLSKFSKKTGGGGGGGNTSNAATDWNNKVMNNSMNYGDVDLRQLKLPMTAYKSYAGQNNLPRNPESEYAFEKLDKAHKKDGYSVDATMDKMKRFDTGDYYDKATLAPEIYNNSDKNVSEELPVPANYSKIPFKVGRMNTGKVPSYLIDYAVQTSKKYGTDPYKTLALMSRESAIGTGGGIEQYDATTDTSSFIPKQTVSAWNFSHKYQPMGFANYAANNGVPGVEASKNVHGYRYDITNEDQLRQEVNKRGEKFYNSYVNTLKNTPVKKENDFELAVKWLKDKNDVSSYNPGDKRYNEMYWQDYNQLKQEPALNQYLKGKLANGGRITKTKFSR